MSVANKFIPHYTYDDYVHWEGKWELIDGFPIAKSPAPTPEHQKVASELRYAFVDSLKKKGCKNCHAYDPIDYMIAKDTIVQPDILIVCEPIKKKYLDFPPALVIEILSPSTALKDRNTKFELYQQQGVKYFLIADIDNKTIETFLLTDAVYKIQTGPSVTFHLPDDCSITPDFSTVFD